MKRFILIFAVMAVPASAAAQDIVVRTQCEILPAEIAKDIEGADYVPGVDVNGNPVAPADLGNNFNNVNYPIDIPIEIDVLEMLNAKPDMEGANAIANAIKIDPDVAHIKLFQDGRTTYNDQDITDHVIYTCGEDGQIIEMPAPVVREEIPAAEEPVVETEPTSDPVPLTQPEPTPAPVQEPDRQEAPDPVVSQGEKLEGSSP